MKAFQRVIREQNQERDPRAVVPLTGCVVEEIALSEARDIILAYEYLGTLPKVSRYQYGLKSPTGELLGVAMFGDGHGSRSNLLCGDEFADQAMCLARGACVHFAHEHAASYMINRATRAAYRDHGALVFYAYADVEAGEIGTVYQASSWLYVGQGAGRGPSGGHRKIWTDLDGKDRSTRWMRADMKRTGMVLDDYRELGWVQRNHPEKHRYVRLEGTPKIRRRLREALQFPVLPYPKRPD